MLIFSVTADPLANVLTCPLMEGPLQNVPAWPLTAELSVSPLTVEPLEHLPVRPLTEKTLETVLACHMTEQLLKHVLVSSLNDESKENVLTYPLMEGPLEKVPVFPRMVKLQERACFFCDGGAAGDSRIGSLAL